MSEASAAELKELRKRRLAMDAILMADGEAPDLETQPMESLEDSDEDAPESEGVGEEDEDMGDDDTPPAEGGEGDEEPPPEEEPPVEGGEGEGDEDEEPPAEGGDEEPPAEEEPMPEGGGDEEPPPEEEPPAEGGEGGEGDEDEEAPPAEGGEGDEDEEPPAEGGEGDEDEEGEDVMSAAKKELLAIADELENTLIEPVVDPDKIDQLPENAVVSMALFGERSDNPFYVMFIDGAPLCRIALQDQNNAASLRDTFLSQGYANSVTDAAKTMPLKELMTSVKAHVYVIRAEKDEIVAKLVEDERAKIEAQSKERTAGFVTTLLELTELVIEAGVKNVIIENPFKATMVDKMIAAGVEDVAAVAMVEEAWREKGREVIDQILSQAQEWMEYSPQGLSEVMKLVGMANYRNPLEAANQPSRREAIERQAHTAEAASIVPESVPLATVSAPPPHVPLPAEAAQFGISASDLSSTRRTGGSIDAWREKGRKGFGIKPRQMHKRGV